MFKIHRKLEYALIALKHILQKSSQQLTTAKEICDIYKTPFDPTSRVLQIMTQNGILKAEQGAHGGYRLSKDLSQISMLELSEMIVGTINITNCSSKQDHADCKISSQCHIMAPMLSLNKKILGLFMDIKIADLIHPAINKRKAIGKKTKQG